MVQTWLRGYASALKQDPSDPQIVDHEYWKSLILKLNEIEELIELGNIPEDWPSAEDELGLYIANKGTRPSWLNAH